MNGSYNNIRVCGVETAVPSTIETNERYIEILGEKRVKKQTRMTGVKERRINDPKQTSADLCIVAARNLMRRLDWSPKEIECLVFVTQSPKFILPSTAFWIQKHLGMSEDSLVFDVNLGCSGYVAGIHIVSSLLQGKKEGCKALLLVGDTQRGEEDADITYTPDDEADRMLFGSAGTATAIEKKMGQPAMYYLDKSIGEQYDVIMRKRNTPTYMNGEAVFEFALNDVVDCCERILKQAEVSKDEIDYVIFHQAQKFVLRNMADLLDFPEEKVLYSCEKYGNTSSGSVPVTICANQSVLTQKKKTRVLLCGFGVGLSCSCMIIELEADSIGTITDSDLIIPE